MNSPFSNHVVSSFKRKLHSGQAKLDSHISIATGMFCRGGSLWDSGVDLTTSLRASFSNELWRSSVPHVAIKSIVCASWTGHVQCTTWNVQLNNSTDVYPVCRVIGLTPTETTGDLYIWAKIKAIEGAIGSRHSAGFKFNLLVLSSAVVTTKRCGQASLALSSSWWACASWQGNDVLAWVMWIGLKCSLLRDSGSATPEQSLA